MYLRKFTEADFLHLQNWITDPEMLFTFAGTNWQFPFTLEQYRAYCHEFPHKYHYLACSDDHKPIGFGEVITNEENSPRLGRLLIGESNSRGQGLGETFIRLLLLEALKLQPTNEVYLFVLEDNAQAIKCYQKVGFAFTSDPPFHLEHAGKTYKTLKMAYRHPHVSS